MLRKNDSKGHQLPIPFSGTLARADDPITSHLAAKELVEDPEKLGKLYGEVLSLLRRNPDKTTNELAQLSGERDPRRIGRRLPELERHGFVIRSAIRRCAVTTKMATAWRTRALGE
jgi:predicted transcriptional regulator